MKHKVKAFKKPIFSKYIKNYKFSLIELIVANVLANCVKSSEVVAEGDENTVQSLQNSSIEYFDAIHNNQICESNRSFLPNSSCSFSNTVTIYYIPTRIELAQYASDIWWTNFDCREFKMAAFEEVSEFISKNNCTLKDAAHMLYQTCTKFQNNDYDDNDNIDFHESFKKLH